MLKERPRARRFELKESRVSRFLDDRIQSIAPGWAQKRKEARLRCAVLDRKGNRLSEGGHRAARSPDYRSGWTRTAKSADAENFPDLEVLRARAYAADRNDPVIHAAVEKLVNKRVGRGIFPQASIDYETIGISKERARALHREQERWFRIWAKHFADASGRQSFYHLLRLADRQLQTAGEFLFLWVRQDFEPYGTGARTRPRGMLSLMAIEPDRLDNPDGSLSRVGFRKGIEIDAYGKALAYHIRENHPHDVYGVGISASRTFVRVPARDEAGRSNVIFGFDSERPGQSRGVPELGPVLTKAKDRDDLDEAMILRAMSEARRIGWVETEHVDEFDEWFDEENEKSTPIEDIDPVQIFYGDVGEKLTIHAPTTPGEMYDPFVQMQKRDISSAMGLPYPHLSADYRGSSWSSMREEKQGVQPGNEVEQDLLIDKICIDAWQRAQEEGFLRGEWGTDIPASEFYRYFCEYTRSRHIPPPDWYVDPGKESEATERELKNLLTTWQIELQKRGLDPDEVLDQHEEWKDELEARGLSVNWGEAGQEAAGNEAEPGSGDEGEAEQ